MWTVLSMTTEKGYERIADLLRVLADAERDLNKGRLDLEGLDKACDAARELYERLVVIRHKAREGGPRPPGGASRMRPGTGSLSLAADPAVPIAPIKLDTRPESRQTSLIDAIAETEKGGKGRKRSTPKDKASVAEKHEHAPIPDLGKAIALSQKFWFIAELFAGDRVKYEQAIEAINGMGNVQEARQHVEKNVLPLLKKKPEEDALAAFMELVERRFQ
ncbi:MAG: hypothetical protein KDB97_03105 [Flavobacteriales bacterium]|nr:hypothetical protein [Flavobacteriales bacterium]